MATVTHNATDATEVSAVFQPFLRYQAPRLVPAAALGLALADAYDGPDACASTTSATSQKGRKISGGPAAAARGNHNKNNSPIPVARLAAAKDAARESFLAAHSTRPAQSSSSASGSGGGVRMAATADAETAATTATTTRKDPAHRLPTPPSSAGKTATRGGPLGTGRTAPGASTKRHGTTNTNTSRATAAPPAEKVLQSVMVNVRGAAPLLNAMFPPAPASSSSSLTNEEPAAAAQWVCFVSTEPATREDVVAMHAQLCERLHARRARATGLCPVRREIYEDVFDELLRQVALEEPARGVLLQRLRDDLRDSLRVHRDLCNRAQHLCSTRCLSAHGDETVVAMEARVADMTRSRDALRAAHHALTVRRAGLETRFEAERAARNKKQQEELAYLRRANQQLSLRLKLETERVTGGVSGSHDNSRTHEVTSVAE